MKKSKKPRPVVPCWCCGSISGVYPLTNISVEGHTDTSPLHFDDVRDSGWWYCFDCGATAQEKPTSLGPGPKIMPWGAMTSVMDRLVREERERARKLR